MTASGRDSSYERPENDQFSTPEKLCVAAVEHARGRGYLPSRGLFLEPSCGEGNFVKALRSTCPNAIIHANDVDPRYEPDRFPNLHGVAEMSHADFLSFRLIPGGYDFVCGNPPYGQKVPNRKKPMHVADAHVVAGIDHLAPGGTLMFLLRLGIFEAVDRYELWQRYPPREVTELNPRPSFKDGPSDSTPYGLCFWTKGYQGDTRFDILKWREKLRRSRKAR